MKYIDADKLIAEIKRKRDSALERQKNLEKIGQETVLNEMIAAELNRLISFVASLQQEQPEVNLEKEVEKYLLENADFVTKSTSNEMVNTLARHFYELGQQSRLETLDTPQEDLDNLLEEEIENYFNGWCNDDEYGQAVMPDCSCASVDDCKDIARHFAEWGARHSINWGDVQLLDTFILELSREEKDGADWGDSEKFYTEVLRRFHEFNDKKISEIVAEWGAEHLKK